MDLGSVRAYGRSLQVYSTIFRDLQNSKILFLFESKISFLRGLVAEYNTFEHKVESWA